MPDNPKKLSQFWQELKRRKVTRTITVYAAAAFVILELVSIIVEPLRLPEWTLPFIIVLLCVGFIIAVILSWIYDIHPEGGIVKTEPVHKVKLGEEHAGSNSWKIASYISFVVIVVMVCVLLYPKIFKSDQFSELRDEEGIISVAVLPFNNLTGDSSLYFWQKGISEYLINGLGSSDELAVSSSQVISDVLEGTRQVYSASLSPDIARRTAGKINASTYITGNYIGAGNDFTIMLNLVNTESGELIWSTRVDGDLESNYRVVLNRLSDTVRNYLEIKAMEEQVETDLSKAYPNSSQAYKHYIDGLNAIMASNYESAIESLSTAYEIDTTFTFAAFYLAFAHCFGNQFSEDLAHWTTRAHELKNNLPSEYHPWIELWYAGFITKDIDDVRRYCNLLDEVAHHSRFLLFDLGVTFNAYLDDYNKSIQAFEKLEALNRQWEDDWRYDRYYHEYAEVLLKADRPEEVDRIADIGLKVNPENRWLILAKGAKSIMLDDTEAIEQYKKELSEIIEKENAGKGEVEHFFGWMHLWAKDTLTAGKHFRLAYESDSEDYKSLIRLIVCQVRSNINIEECLSLSEIGLENQPESGPFLWCKGYALHKMGRHEEALAILREAEGKFMGYIKDLQKDIQEVELALAKL
jgi:TolB-like protein